MKDRRLTAIVTAERGVSSLTRHGLEEYISDCVILLDHRVPGKNESRRLAEQQELDLESASRGRPAIAKSRFLNVGGPEDNQMKVSNPGGAA